MLPVHVQLSYCNNNYRIVHCLLISFVLDNSIVHSVLAHRSLFDYMKTISRAAKYLRGKGSDSVLEGVNVVVLI